MVRAYKNKKLGFWLQPLRLLVLMVIACLLAPSVPAAERNFVNSELNRFGRSKLTADQKRAASIADRYNRQKKKTKAPQLAPPPSAVDQIEETSARSALRAPDDTPNFYSLVKIDCVHMLAKGAEKKYPKATISRVQQQLIALGFELGQVDGLLGSNTQSAIGAFCKIDQAYPQWPSILASHDFESWAVKEPDPSEIDQARLSGNAGVVIALLDRYMRRKTFTPVKWTEDFLVSYNLTEEDFKQLNALKDIFKLIAKLQGESYASGQALEGALKTALTGVAEPERYVQLILKYAESQTGVTLTEKSFKKLQVANTPDYLLQSLRTLQGLNYPDGKINGAVQPLLETLIDKVMGFTPEIMKLAKISPSGAKFTEGSLKAFAEAQKDDLLAVAVLDKLKNMQDVEYQSDKTMTSAVRNVLMQLVEQIENFQPVIVQSAEEVSGFSLSAASMQEIEARLKDFAIPEVYLEMLADMQDVDYPDADLFWLAMKAKIAIIGSNNTFREKIFGVINLKVANKIDDALLEKMKIQGLPPALLTQLKTLQDRKFEDTEALEKAIDDLFEQLSKQYDQFRPLLVAQGRKTHPFDKTKNIHWDGESCNCVHQNLAGEIYGLYPYWMAGEKQVIDFSMLTRIGYDGLSFNDKGDIAHESRWSKLDTQFIREAQTYGTKVDLVVYRNDWKTWSLSSADDKRIAFDNLAGNIARLVDIPLNNLYSKAKPYISLGASKQPVMGDGVTLYFDGYPEDSESVAAFDDFIQTLSTQMRIQMQGRPSSINIMFRSAEMGKGIHAYPKLIEQMDMIQGKDNKLNNLFLVLLQEPTTNDKKLLRLNVEQGSHGKDRMKLLRNIVMTLTFDGHNTDQLTDDVIYAKDNFGGIGFWPQSVVQGSETGVLALSSGHISDALHANFLNVSDWDAPLVCKYVCPNKWTFRIAWGLFFLAMLGAIAFRFVSCAWRSFFDQHFIHLLVGIVVPAALLTLALLFCDPSWQQISKGNGALILMFVGVIGYSVWNYHDKKRKANLP